MRGLRRRYVLTDVAVFPARIGPLGYAFINFGSIEEAVRAYGQLQNSVISALTGNKQLKMRFKPIAVRSPPSPAPPLRPRRAWLPCCPLAAGQPPQHALCRASGQMRSLSANNIPLNAGQSLTSCLCSGRLAECASPRSVCAGQLGLHRTGPTPKQQLTDRHERHPDAHSRALARL